MTTSFFLEFVRSTYEFLNRVPKEILEDPNFKATIALLPANYNFAMPETIHRIRSSGAQKVALQLPEGLLLFAITISDIRTQFCPGNRDAYG
ncbi:Diphthamide biosynthesis protein 1 [Fusarium solani]